MTITTPEGHDATAAPRRKWRAAGAQLLGGITTFLDTRTRRKTRSYYQNHKHSQLERARRDVNNLWQGRL